MRELTPVTWTEAEPVRLARDIADVEALSSGLIFTPPSAGSAGKPGHHGHWHGELPLWPFDRPAPSGLSHLVPTGLKFVMFYQASHPMVPPRVYPVDPKPLILEHTQHRWHVAPGGSLCLLQRDGLWTPEASVTELLLKAAGWRIEYAVLKAEGAEAMTEHGIVTDDSQDALISQLADQDARDTPRPVTPRRPT